MLRNEAAQGPIGPSRLLAQALLAQKALDQLAQLVGRYEKQGAAMFKAGLRGGMDPAESGAAAGDGAPISAAPPPPSSMEEDRENTRLLRSYRKRAGTKAPGVRRGTYRCIHGEARSGRVSATRSMT